jgi:hypothetical protein
MSTSTPTAGIDLETPKHILYTNKHRQAIDLKLFGSRNEALFEVKKRFFENRTSLELDFKCWLALTKPENFDFKWNLEYKSSVDDGFLLKNGILVNPKLPTKIKMTLQNDGSFRLYLSREDDRRVCEALHLLEPVVEVICYLKFLSVAKGFYCGLVVLRRCDGLSRQAELSSHLFEELHRSVHADCRRLPADDLCQETHRPQRCIAYCQANFAKYSSRVAIPNLQVKAETSEETTYYDTYLNDYKNSVETLKKHHLRRLAALYEHRQPQVVQRNFRYRELGSNYSEELYENVGRSFFRLLRQISIGERNIPQLQFEYNHEPKVVARNTLALYDGLLAKAHSWSDERPDDVLDLIDQIHAWNDTLIYADLLNSMQECSTKEETGDVKARNAKKKEHDEKRSERREERKKKEKDFDAENEESIRKANELSQTVKKLKTPMSPLKFAEVILSLANLDVLRLKMKSKAKTATTSSAIAETKKKMWKLVEKLKNDQSSSSEEPLVKLTLAFADKFDPERMNRVKIAMRKQAWTHNTNLHKKNMEHQSHQNLKSLQDALDTGESNFIASDKLGDTEEALLQSAHTQVRALLRAWQNVNDRYTYDLDRLGVSNIVRANENDDDVKTQIHDLQILLENTKNASDIMGAVILWALDVLELEELPFPTDFPEPKPVRKNKLDKVSTYLQQHILPYLQQHHLEKRYISFLANRAVSRLKAVRKLHFTSLATARAKAKP